MPTLDSLPGDQRAVLQLVLGRGRSYEEIARLLKMPSAAVRDRAVAALEALGPQTGVSREHRAMITDYLLGQLPEPVVGQARNLLATSAPERAWARVVSAELAGLSASPLPQIPSQGDGPAVPDTPPAVEPEPAESDPEPASEGSGSEPAAPAAPTPSLPGRTPPEPLGGAAEPQERRRGRLRRRGGDPAPDDAPAGSRSSRRGGALVLAAAAIALALVIYFVASSGGGSHPHPVAATPSSTTSTTTATSSTAAAAGTTTSTSTGARVISQINLTPPSGSGKAAGIAQVVSEGSSLGVAIAADNIPPNTSHNAYAVWLYSSPSAALLLGFVNPGVGSNGRLSTAGSLPSTASHYKYLIVTLETSGKPKTPGMIVLRGTLTGV